MARRKTQKHKLKHSRKWTTLKSTNSVGGGLIWDSNREKIIKRLIKLKAILPFQGQDIVKKADKGSNKKEKIKYFVDESINILLFNLFTIWKLNGSKITNNAYEKLANTMKTPFSSDIKWQYDKLHNIATEYGNIAESNKQELFKLLDSNRDVSNSASASGILTCIYQLNENWIKKASTTITQPKFDDLYRNWFNEKNDNNYYGTWRPWWMW